MTTGPDTPRTSDLTAGPKPVAPAASAQLSAMDRFGTPVWIAAGILVVGLAVVAAAVA